MYGEIPNGGIRIRVHNQPKTALVRLPLHQEILDRLAQQKSTRRTLGLYSLRHHGSRTRRAAGATRE